MSSAETKPESPVLSVPVAHSLSVVYNEKEDRLLLTLGAKEVRLRLLLTPQRTKKLLT